MLAASGAESRMFSSSFWSREEGAAEAYIPCRTQGECGFKAGPEVACIPLRTRASHIFNLPSYVQIATRAGAGGRLVARGGAVVTAFC